jgi:DNA polymerase-3 subunit delta'
VSTAPSSELPPWLEGPLTRGLELSGHAVLVHGPGALGQFELAMALAQAWLCEDAHSDGRACGRCSSCRLVTAHSHGDLRVLLPEALRGALGWADAGDEASDESDGKSSKAKPSRDIRVDAVRAAIDWGQRTSARGRAKVMIIHPAEAMNGVTANALLKTLEEPPGRLRLVLTAHDTESLLPTLRSRCQRLKLEAPSIRSGSDWLSHLGVERAEVLLAATDGQPQAALALLAEGIDAHAWERVPGWVRRGDAMGLVTWPVARVVDALAKLCHDLMSGAVNGTPRYFEAAALAPALKPAPPSLARLAAWSVALRQAARHDEHPWHAGLRIEALVAQAASLWQTAQEPNRGEGGPLDTLAVR